MTPANNQSTTRQQLRRSLGVLGLAILTFALVTGTITQRKVCPVQLATPPNKTTPIDSATRISSDENSKDHSLSLLAYNLQLRPRLLFASSQSERVQHLVPLLQGYDAIVLSEAFDDYALTELLTQLKTTYPHISSPLGQNKGLDQDSGLVIASRWPIEIGAQHQKIFEGPCQGTSCFNDQGILIIGINKAGTRYHLLTAQMQSGTNQRAKNIRAGQIQQIQQFIEVINIPEEEPIIFGASFPIALLTSPEEYEHLITTLSITQPERIGPLKHSLDPTQNTLAKPGPSQTPDALFTFTQHQHPQTATLQIRPLRTSPEQAWKPLSWLYWQCPHQDISDHYAIEGTFHYGN